MSSESNKMECRVSYLGDCGLVVKRHAGFSHCRDCIRSFSHQSVFPGDTLNVSCLKGSVVYHQRVMEGHVTSDFICEREDSGMVNLTHFSQPWSALSVAYFLAGGERGGSAEHCGGVRQYPWAPPTRCQWQPHPQS